MTPASPSHRSASAIFLRVQREPRIAFDGDEALRPMIGEQFLRIVAAGQPVEQALHLVAALVRVLARALGAEDDDQAPALVLPFADPAVP